MSSKKDICQSYDFISKSTKKSLLYLSTYGYYNKQYFENITKCCNLIVKMEKKLVKTKNESYKFGEYHSDR